MKSTERVLEHTAGADQLKGRMEIMRLFERSPMAQEDCLFNLGMYVRSGLLVKFLLLAEVYKRAMKVPGVMAEFGVWYGQSLVLLENLRAIYESFNKQRRIVGFDSFTGYSEGKWAKTGLYNTGRKYIGYLDKLLKAHAKANVYGHQPCPHELIEGDAGHEAHAYFDAHPELTVALAILDMGPYEVTKDVLKAIKPRLLPGSIVLLDEFTLADTPGEATAWLEVMGTKGYRMEPIALYPTKTLVEIL